MLNRREQFLNTMKSLLAFLVCCVVLANTQFLGLVERYCMNSRKLEIVLCANAHGGQQIPVIYQHCVSAIKNGLTELPQMDEFMCSKMNYMEYHVFQGCFYGSLMVHDSRSKNLTQVADWCLKQHELRFPYDLRPQFQKPVLSQWIDTKSAI